MPTKGRRAATLEPRTRKAPRLQAHVATSRATNGIRFGHGVSPSIHQRPPTAVDDDDAVMQTSTSVSDAVCLEPLQGSRSRVHLDLSHQVILLARHTRRNRSPAHAHTHVTCSITTTTKHRKTTHLTGRRQTNTQHRRSQHLISHPPHESPYPSTASRPRSAHAPAGCARSRTSPAHLAT